MPVFLRILLLTATTALLSSCLDYEEELTLNENLSGEVLVTLTLPDTLGTKFKELPGLFSEKNLQSYLEKAKGIRLLSYQYRAERRPEVKMRFAFNSLEAWNEAVSLHPQAAVLTGKFALKKTGGGVAVERQMGVGNVETAELPDFNYANYTMRFRSPILTTNSPQFNKHGNEVRYRYTLRKLLAQQPVYSITIERSQPWLWIGIGTLAALFALWKAWATWLKPKKKSA